MIQGITAIVRDSAVLDSRRQDQLAKLSPPNLALVLRSSSQPAGTCVAVLGRLSADQAAQAIVSQDGTGSWLSGLGNAERSHAVLIAAAKANAGILAQRLTQVPVDSATSLFSDLSSSPTDFRQVAQELHLVFPWHLALLADRARIPDSQREDLRQLALQTIQVWPWIAATRAMLAISPAMHDATASAWLTRIRIWWWIRDAAATWTPHLQNQRRREMWIFAAGFATAILLVLIHVALSSP